MKHLILFLLLSSTLTAQTVTHHEDERGRRWAIHTFERPERDSVIAYVYGKPERSDRAIIWMTKNNRGFDGLYFFKARRKEPKVWSFFPVR